MKKILIICALMALGAQLFAQDWYFRPTDTIRTLRVPGLHYTEWFDTCPLYSNPRSRLSIGVTSSSAPQAINVFPKHSDHRMAIKGLACLLPTNLRQQCGDQYQSAELNKMPEYLYLFSHIKDTADPLGHIDMYYSRLQVVDSVRWDTVKPDYYILPHNSASDSCGSQDVLLFRAYFEKTYYVDTLFFIGGSYHSNSVDLYPGYVWNHIPTHYIHLYCEYQGGGLYNEICGPYDRVGGSGNPDFNGGLFAMDPGYHWFSGMMAILEDWDLTVMPNDSTMGTTSGSGTFYDGDSAHIEAVPFPGYRFAHWSDNNTNPIRDIRIMDNTTMTAYFEEIGSNHENIDNCEQEMSIALSPNPTTGRVNISADERIKGVSVYDMAGKAIGRPRTNHSQSTEMELDLSGLPNGTYVVKIETEKGTATRKVIIDK